MEYVKTIKKKKKNKIKRIGDNIPFLQIEYLVDYISQKAFLRKFS